jgi:hypothetical protein
MRLTVGPLPPAVYWRRRTIVLAAVLVLLFLVAQACLSSPASPDGDVTGDLTSSPAAGGSASPVTGPGGGSAGPTDRLGPSGSPGGADLPGAGGPLGAGNPPAGGDLPGSGLDPSDPRSCTDQEMRVAAVAEQVTFPAGTPVQFTIRIQNGAERSCWRDIGGDQRELYLRSGTGATKRWSSRDCGGPSGSDIRELEPGFATSHFIAWQGRSSEVCAGGEPAGELVEPGGYQLVARLGAAFSEPVEITVTG